MKTPEQKNLPFESTDRSEPKEEQSYGESSPEDADERSRLEGVYGEGAGAAPLTTKEQKRKQQGRKEHIEELRGKIRRFLAGDV